MLNFDNGFAQSKGINKLEPVWLIMFIERATSFNSAGHRLEYIESL